MITEEQKKINELREVIDYLIETYCPERSFDNVRDRAMYEQTDAYQDDIARDRNGDTRCDEKRDEG